MLESRTLSIAIDRPWTAVYEAIWGPERGGSSADSVRVVASSNVSFGRAVALNCVSGAFWAASS